MAASQQVNFRIPPDILERIDHNASQQGLTRTEYLLSWLPDTYDSTTEPEQQAQDSEAR